MQAREMTSERRCRSRAAAALLLVLSAVLISAGCGSDSSGSADATNAANSKEAADSTNAADTSNAPVDKGKLLLAVRPEGHPERKLLGHVYAQALRLAGYRVRRAPPVTIGVAVPLDQLKLGQIAGYPEYLSTALVYQFDTALEDLPVQARAAYEQAKKGLEKEGLTAFPPAPYSIENGVGMLRKTAERRDLETNSDLKGKAEAMTIKAPTYCHVSVECLGGIEQHYDTAFKLVSYEAKRVSELTWWRPEPAFRYEVLEDGVSDASMLFTTDGRLAREGDKFVVLEDDKGVFPASNVVWVTSPQVVERAGPDYERAILAAQRGLTLEVIRKLNAKVELGKAPARVAAEYLQSTGYSG